MLDDAKAELQLSRNTEEALQKQITRLQADLKQRSSSSKNGQKSGADVDASLKQANAEVQKLQAELKKTDKLNAELAEAKKTILKLADANSGKEQTLTKKVTTLQADLKKEKATVQALKKELKQAEKVKAELEKAKVKLGQQAKSGAKAPAKLARATSSKLATQNESRFLTPKYHKPLRRASMKPGASQNSKLSNSDIGWYD